MPKRRIAKMMKMIFFLLMWYCRMEQSLFYKTKDQKEILMNFQAFFQACFSQFVPSLPNSRGSPDIQPRRPIRLKHHHFMPSPSKCKHYSGSTLRKANFASLFLKEHFTTTLICCQGCCECGYCPIYEFNSEMYGLKKILYNFEKTLFRERKKRINCIEEKEKKKKEKTYQRFPYRESNPGRLGENQES